MKFLALIPARYASTRFPGKPLADLMGKPMIQHVYEKAHAVFDACYVATDDPRIEQAVLSFGGRVVMTSSESQRYRPLPGSAGGSGAGDWHGIRCGCEYPGR